MKIHETIKQETGTRNDLVISYLVLRKALGLLGVALPFVLALGGMLFHGLETQSSISAYYHTEMRDIFVGTLCAFGVFLFAYKGPEPQDDIAGDLACIFALGVAFLPTAPVAPSPLEETISRLHLLCAALFFLTLAYFSLFLFTKSKSRKPASPQKKLRNMVYRICGCIMLLALGAIILLALLPNLTAQIESLDPVFWLEAIALIAFGVSWFIKGEGLLGDII